MKRCKPYLPLLISAASLLATWAVIEYSSFGFIYLTGIKGEGLNEERPIGWMHPVFSNDQEERVKLQQNWHPYRTYANPLNVEARIGPLSTDQYGFTHNGTLREYVTPKPPRVKRIILLGGSSAEGHGASNSMTVAAQLEKLLNRTSQQEFEVINAGVGGYASISSLLYLTVDLMKFEPDYVITFDGFNDIWGAVDVFHEKRLITPNYSMYQHDTLSGLIETSYRLNSVWFHVTKALGLIREKIFPYASAIVEHYGFLKQGEGLIRRMGTDLQGSTHPADYQKLSETTARQYLLNLKMLAAICSVNNIRLVLTIQPHYILHSSLDRHHIRQKRFLATFLDYYAMIEEGVLQMEEQAADFLRVLSFVPIFREAEDTFFVDSVHLNEDGQSIVAQKISSVISGFVEEG